MKGWKVLLLLILMVITTTNILAVNFRINASTDYVNAYDTEASNLSGGAPQRYGVDVSGGCVGWIVAGEWLEFNIPLTGRYKVKAMVATPNNGMKYSMTVNTLGQGTVTLPNTGGWGNYQLIDAGDITVKTGDILRLKMDSGNFNLNYIELIEEAPTGVIDSFNKYYVNGWVFDRNIGYSEAVAHIHLYKDGVHIAGIAGTVEDRIDVKNYFNSIAPDTARSSRLGYRADLTPYIQGKGEYWIDAYAINYGNNLPAPASEHVYLGRKKVIIPASGTGPGWVDINSFIGENTVSQPGWAYDGDGISTMQSTVEVKAVMQGGSGKVYTQTVIANGNRPDLISNGGGLKTDTSDTKEYFAAAAPDPNHGWTAIFAGLDPGRYRVTAKIIGGSGRVLGGSGAERTEFVIGANAGIDSSGRYQIMMAKVDSTLYGAGAIKQGVVALDDTEIKTSLMKSIAQSNANGVYEAFYNFNWQNDVAAYTKLENDNQWFNPKKSTDGGRNYFVFRRDMEKSAATTTEYANRKIREDNKLYPLYSMPYGTKSNSLAVSSTGSAPAGGTLLGYTYRDGLEAGVTLGYDIKSAITDYFVTGNWAESAYFIQNKGYGSGSVAGFAADKSDTLATKTLYRLYNSATGNHKISLVTSEPGYVLDTSATGSGSMLSDGIIGKIFANTTSTNKTVSKVFSYPKIPVLTSVSNYEKMSIKWADDNSANYARQNYVVRISYAADANTIPPRCEFYESKNKINGVYNKGFDAGGGIQNINNTSAVTTFLNNGSNGTYVDFIFRKETKESNVYPHSAGEGKVSIDGTNRQFTIEGLPSGYYKIQLYSIKSDRDNTIGAFSCGGVVDWDITFAPQKGNEDQSVIFDMTKYPPLSMFDTLKVNDNYSSNDYKAMKTRNTTVLESLENFGTEAETVFGKNTRTKDWKVLGTPLYKGLMINKSVADSSVSNGAGYGYLSNESSSKIFEFYYPLKFIHNPISLSGDRATIKWTKVDKNVYQDRYFNNQRLMIRLARKSGGAVQEYKYTPYEKLNGYNEANDSKLKDFLTNTATTVKYVDFKFGYYDPAHTFYSTSGVMTDYTPGQFTIAGLPLNQEYELQLYSLRDDSAGKYRVITREFKDSFQAGKPLVDEGVNAKENDIYLVDTIKVSSFPNIECHFSTKTKYNVNLTNENIFMKGTDTKSRMEERKGVLKSSVGLAPSDISPSTLQGLVYPLDIVMCIDNSGSMQNEIDSVKSGIKGFVDELKKRGFDVKINMVGFGPGQNWNRWIYTSPGVNDSWESDYDRGGSFTQNGRKYTFSYYGKPTGGYTVFKNSDYMAVYKEKWFSGISDVENALEEMHATGGYKNGQENGGTAIAKAIELLKNNGRSIDMNRNIIDNSTGVVPSKKWIIILTDENMDADTLPFGATKDNAISTIASNLTIDAGKNDLITLTGVFHVDKNVTQTDLDNAAAGKIDIRYSNGVPYVHDDLGKQGTYPADDGDRFYCDFKYGGLDTRFKMYDMGSNGELVASALKASIDDIGVIKRWKMTYKSPYPERDGTNREIVFDVRNLVSLQDNTKVIGRLRDKNDPADGGNASYRTYKAPSLNLEWKITKPDELSSKPKFELDPLDKSKILIKGWATNKIVPLRNVKIWLTPWGASSGSKILNTDKMFLFSYPTGFNATPQDFNMRINKSDLKSVMYNGVRVKYFNLYAELLDEQGEKDFKLIEKVALDVDPPKITAIRITNTSLGAMLIAMKNGDTNIFDSTTSPQYSQLVYENAKLRNINYETAAAPYTFAGITNRTGFAHTSYQGYFVKRNDNLVVEVTFEDENIGTTSISTAMAGENCVYANFSELTVSETNPSFTTRRPVIMSSGIEGYEFTATWRFKADKIINNDGLKKAVIEAIDEMGNKVTSVAKDIEISVMDNTPPSMSAPSLTEVPNMIKYNDTNKTTIPEITFGSDKRQISNQDFILRSNTGKDITGAPSADLYGVLVYKATYTYDKTKSDYNRNGSRATGTGEHGKDKNLDGNSANEFYYRAVKSGSVFTGDGLRKVNVNTHGDDGKYSYSTYAIDYAGNLSTVAVWKDAYVDTIEPLILTPSAILRKTHDKNNYLDFNNQPILGRDNYVKNGDKVHIEYAVSDYNFPKDINYLKGSNPNPPNQQLPDYKVYTESDPTKQIPKISMVGNESPYSVTIGNNGEDEFAVKGKASETDGTKPLTVYAKDGAGNETLYNINTVFDNTAPTISLKAYAVPLEKIRGNGGKILDNLPIIALNKKGWNYWGKDTTKSVEYMTNWSDTIRNIVDNEVEIGNRKMTFTKYLNGGVGTPTPDVYYELRGDPNPTDAAATDGLSGIMMYELKCGAAVNYVPANDMPYGSIVGGYLNPNSLTGVYDANNGFGLVGNLGNVGKVEISAIDWSGNKSAVKLSENTIKIDTSINLPANPIGGNSVTLTVNNGTISIPLNFAKIGEASGVWKYKIIDFKDERGNVVATSFVEKKEGSAVATMTRGNYKEGASASLESLAEAESTVHSEIVFDELGTHIKNRTLEATGLNPNAVYTGGKVRLTIEVMDHLVNTAQFSKDFIVQRGGIIIRAQDNDTNKEIRTTIQQGQEAAVLDRIEGGR